MPLQYERLRKNMVDCQLLPNKITDEAVIAAFSMTAREHYLPRNLDKKAYSDCELMIAPNRMLSTPLSNATLLQALSISTHDQVLIVGVASGYLMAVCAQITENVYGIDHDAKHITQAQSDLEAHDITNAFAIHTDPVKGCPEFAPFDVIIFDGAIDVLPECFVDQLVAGGRIGMCQMIDGLPRLSIQQKSGEALHLSACFDFTLPDLPRFQAPVEFRL
ncbi:MAG: hypothetical protein AAF352_04795 [Pseudomonadota bacterium]